MSYDCLMADLQDLVDEASLLLEGPVTLEDRRFRLLAFAAHPGATDPVRVETILGKGAGPQVRAWFEGFGIARATGPVPVPGDPDRGIGPRLCLPARGRGVVQGYLWVIGEGSRYAPERVAAAMHLADEAGEQLARQVSRRRATERLLHELLEAGPAERSAGARALADDLAVAPGSRAVVAVLGAAPGQRLSAESLRGAGGLPRRAAVGDAEGDVVLLLPLVGSAGADDPLGEARSLVERALGQLEKEDPGRTVVAGMGQVVPLGEAGDSWGQARAALRVVRPDGPAGRSGPAATRVHAWDELGVRRMLGGSHADALAEAARTPAVRALLGADPELVRTARVYLDRAGSVAATAGELDLHRQSVYHRLGRIEQITGLDLADGRHRLELHLGLLVTDPDGGGRPG